jgi:hypothetical protein
MSETRLKRADLLDNDSLANNKRFDSVLPGARRDWGDVRGVDRDRAAEALRDREVERTRPDLARSISHRAFSAGELGREGDDPGQSF